MSLTEETGLADLTDDVRRALLLAATLLTWHKRWRFQAERTHTYSGGPSRRHLLQLGTGGRPHWPERTPLLARRLLVRGEFRPPPPVGKLFHLRGQILLDRS